MIYALPESVQYINTHQNMSDAVHWAVSYLLSPQEQHSNVANEQWTEIMIEADADTRSYISSVRGCAVVMTTDTQRPV